MIGSDLCQEILNMTKCAKESSSCKTLIGLNGVVQADNLSLPFRPNSFDAIISISVIHHFSTEKRRRNAIQQCAQLLKPGGKLLIYVWAFEQTQRSFAAQDVLVPWNTPSSFPFPPPITNSTESVDSVDGLPKGCHCHCYESSLDVSNICADRRHSHILNELCDTVDHSQRFKTRQLTLELKINPENKMVTDSLHGYSSQEVLQSSTGKKRFQFFRRGNRKTTDVSSVSDNLPHDKIDRKISETLTIPRQSLFFYSPSHLRRCLSAWLGFAIPINETLIGEFAENFTKVTLSAATMVASIVTKHQKDITSSTQDQNPRNISTQHFQSPNTQQESIAFNDAQICSISGNRADQEKKSGVVPGTEGKGNQQYETTMGERTGAEPMPAISPAMERIRHDLKFARSCLSPKRQHSYEPPQSAPMLRRLQGTSMSDSCGHAPKSASAMSTGSNTFFRYYHVFKKGELETLICKVGGLEIIESFFDHANWCVVAQKK